MLNLNSLFSAAEDFAETESRINHQELIGVTDGKAVGTYVEHNFDDFLIRTFPSIEIGNSANGIDLPDKRVNCDIKVTSIRQPQSSCPYRSARQKVYGLGYNLLLFVYEKQDTHSCCTLDFQHVALIEAKRTADYSLTKMIWQMLDAGAIQEEIYGLLVDKGLPGDEIVLNQLAEDIMRNHPEQGYLTISNALQWRLQYRRVLTLNGTVEGIINYDR